MGIPRLKGMKGFLLLWVGQVFSMLGSQVALFAITFWTYQQTGKATPVAMLGFFNVIPIILLGLFTGALVDRWSRRVTILMSDIGSLLVNGFCSFL